MRAMKLTYIFAAILICSIIGTLVSARSAKTILLAVCAVLSGYGLFRLLG